MHVLHARWLLRDADTLHPGGGVVVEGGRLRAILANASAVERASVEAETSEDLGEVVLTPGLVNAHAHLDLTALAGRVPAAGGFGAWVQRLLLERAASDGAELAAGARRGADRLLETGATCVGDVDSTGLTRGALADHPLRAVLYREVLDAHDPGRSEDALRAVADAPTPAHGRVEGLSPHAPFTVSPALLARLGVLARARALPVAVHWSETAAEVEWLLEGRGPLATLLGPSPRRSGLELLEEAGLLGPATALVHGNLPAHGEPERLAALGVSLVHCPGTHRFFGRERAPLERYLQAGVNVALGTDSLASNRDLDLRLEMAVLRSEYPGLAPGRVWSMATVCGARALGEDARGRSGALAPGRAADLAAFEVEATMPETILEELTAGIPPVASVWVEGERWGGSRGEVSS